VQYADFPKENLAPVLTADTVHRPRSGNQPLAAKELARLFESNEDTVRKNLLRCPQQPGLLGWHTGLNPEVESLLVWMLVDAFHEEKSDDTEGVLEDCQGATKF
jgi:hypothetical protein